ncbi:hypothetical protein PROFUN_06243 [Planoprotostelium fungivorum]|uniref:PAS domain-containing protein n=1 Tax=Planoprotostelium fungivorum TaxID=1890364 RepID=A0A2P6NE77_9EUKA|nr:hypothetical protein PROFUN_06243 [Planoprotostelium fungivorum]
MAALTTWEKYTQYGGLFYKRQDSVLSLDPLVFGGEEKGWRLWRFLERYSLEVPSPSVGTTMTVIGPKEATHLKMKRQRIEEPGASKAAMNALMEDKATVVIAFPNGNPVIEFINHEGETLLSQLLKQTDEARYRRMDTKNGTRVVVTAKKVDGKTTDVARLFLQHSPTDDIRTLANAVEDDIVGRVLGMDLLCIILQVEERNVAKYISVNSSMARLFGRTIDEVRGRTSVELNQPTLHTIRVYDRLYSHLDSATKTARFALHWANQSHFCEFREIKPGTFLGLNMVYHRQSGPEPLTPSGSVVPSVWIRTKWDEFVVECIRFIYHHPRYASKEKMKLPSGFLSVTLASSTECIAESFTDNIDKVFCYAYIGDSFIPSGDSDGHIWKSSRNTVCTGDSLEDTRRETLTVHPGNVQRRYFYTQLPNGSNLRRRVIWMEDMKGIYMVEYRHSKANNTNTELIHLLGPECMDWPDLVSNLHSRSSPEFNESVEKINTCFNMALTRTEQKDFESEDVMSYVNQILHNWASDYYKKAEIEISAYASEDPNEGGISRDYSDQIGTIDTSYTTWFYAQFPPRYRNGQIDQDEAEEDSALQKTVEEKKDSAENPWPERISVATVVAKGGLNIVEYSIEHGFQIARMTTSYSLRIGKVLTCGFLSLFVPTTWRTCADKKEKQQSPVIRTIGVGFDKVETLAIRSIDFGSYLTKSALDVATASVETVDRVFGRREDPYMQS